MEGSIENQCGALGGLFQQIVNDMKSSSPIWEDFISKAAKLHTALKATIVATSSFLDAFQRVADMATNTRGATREIGSALTRLCMRHRSIEQKLKKFTSIIMDTLVIPLQERVDDWKRAVLQLDKDHAKEYKKARQEIKRASSDTLRLQKKVRKGKCDMQTRLDTALQDVTGKFQLLEETEKNAVRKALMEERSHFCLFISHCKPVVDEEIAMLEEVTHLQEILQSLCMQAGDPNSLPAASEQVILDIKGDGQSFTFQTPPSSPSSLGSRKSSMCSISSMASSSSGSTQSHSPSHQLRHRNTSQPPPGGAIRLSSVSSQDSGFTSQDTLFLKPSTPPLHDYKRKSSLQESSSSSGTGTDSNATTPSPSFPIPPSTSASTWSNWPDPPHNMVRQQQESCNVIERPHTISTAYERSHGGGSGHSRPPLTAHMFEPPDERSMEKMHPQTAPTSPSPYAVPCIIPQIEQQQQQQKAEVTKGKPPPVPGPKPRGRPVAPPTVPEFMPNVDQSKKTNVMPPPMYVNMNQLATLAMQNQAAKLQHASELDKPVPVEEDARGSGPAADENRPPGTERSISLPAQAPNSSELAEAIKELEASTAALQMAYDTQTTSQSSLQCSSGYGTMNSTPTCSESTISSEDTEPDPQQLLDNLVQNLSVGKEPNIPDMGPDKFYTLPRKGATARCFQELYSSGKRPASTAGVPAVNSGVATIRRSSLQVGKPSPPVRRTMSIAGGIPVVPPMVPGSGKSSAPRGRSPSHRRTHSVGSTGSGSSSSSQPELEPQPQSSPLNLSGDDLPLPPPPPPEELTFPPEQLAALSHNSSSSSLSSDSTLDNSPQPGSHGSIVSKHANVMQSLNQKLGAVLQTVPTPPVKQVQAPPHVQQARHQAQQQQLVYAQPQQTLPHQHYSSEASENATTPTATNQASFDSLSSDDITPTGDPPADSLVNQISRGVKLRKTISNDRSAPRF